MNTKKKLIFSILMIFVLCLSATAISAADDDDAKMADSQDDDALACDLENIEIETADNDAGELSSPAESEILSEDKIDTSTVTVEVVNGTEYRSGKVILDFSDVYDSEYPIYSEDTYLTINEETIYGDNGYYDSDLDDYIYYKYVFYMPELDLKDYDFTINYAGNDYYAANTFTGTYYVNEAQKIDTSTATVKVVNGTKNTNGEILLDFSEICDDWYDTPIYSDDTYITINGETITGKATNYYHWYYGAWYKFNMPELEEAEYPFTIHYGGNGYYTAHEFSGTYYVTKLPLYVGIYPNSVKEGTNGSIEVWIYDDVYRDDSEPWLSYGITDATLIVNGKEYKFNVQASNYIDEGTLITIDSLPAGNYDVSFRFAGDENYMAVEEFVAEEQFSVISKENKANITSIYTDTTNAYKGNNLTINYEIYEKVYGIDMNGKIKIILVDENENEYEYLADVDEYGEGSIDLGWNLTGGIYTFKLQYMGNEYYNPSELIEAKDWDDEPVTLTIYDENNKIPIGYISLDYSSSILKGENTTFNVSMDEDYQISDIPFTGTVKIILTNYYDEEEVVEYIVALDKNGKGSINLGYNLTGPSYSVSVDYIDDPVYSYESESYFKNLELISEENKAQIEWYEIYTNVKSTFEGKNGTITLNFTYAKKENIPFDGNVTIQLSYYDWDSQKGEDFVYVLNIINNIATVDLGYNFTYNYYTIYLTELNSTYYCIDDEYWYSLGAFDIYDEENKAPIQIIANINDIAEGQNATLSVDLSDSRVSDMPMDGRLKIVLTDSNENEYEYIVDIDTNGKGSIDLGYNLTSGEYNLQATYLGNNYYTAPDYEVYIGYLNIYGEGYKAYISHGLNYSFDNITKGQNTTITLDLSPYRISDLSMAGTLNITLVNYKNDDEYYYLNDYVVDDSGKCIAVLGDNLPVGKYYFKLSYSGNNFYYEDTSFILYKKTYFYSDDEIDWDWDDVYIYVVERTAPAATSLSASNVNINANPNSGTFKVTLKSNGAALAGQNVTITFNGKSYTALTDKNGVASFKLSSGVAKKYPVAISFAGNDKYLSSTANAYVTIKKNAVKFSSPTKKVKKAKAKKAKFKITLKTSNKKALAKKLVYIKINKKTYKAKTNKKGVAVFKLKLAKKKKTYKYAVSFKGDKANAKKTYKGKLAVK